jgi:hypothetical protein
VPWNVGEVAINGQLYMLLGWHTSINLIPSLVLRTVFLTGTTVLVFSRKMHNGISRMGLRSTVSAFPREDLETS